MGRRKSKRKAPAKRKLITPLEKVFTCPFCNHEKSCDVKMDLDKNTAHIRCGVCSEDFQTVINCKLPVIYIYPNPNIYILNYSFIDLDLTEPIDVYNEWIDACESVNN